MRNTLSAGTHDFNITFEEPVVLTVPHLLKVIKWSAFYSFDTVSADLGNNKFYYNNGTTDEVITIPDGNYNYSDLFARVASLVDANGDDSASVYFTADVNTGKITLNLANSYTVDFTQADTFEDVLGFNSSVYLATSTAPSIGNINRNIDKLILNTDIISPVNFTNCCKSRQISSITCNNIPNTRMLSQGTDDLYHQVDPGNYTTIRFWITDPLNRPVNLNGRDVSIEFELRPMKDEMGY